MGEQEPATICGRRYPWMIGPASPYGGEILIGTILSLWRNPPMGSRELSPYGGEILIGTVLSLWRNPPMGSRELSLYRGGKIPIGITLLL
jgi:hypothetical protein